MQSMSGPSRPPSPRSSLAELPLREAIRRAMLDAAAPSAIDGAGCLLLDRDGALRFGAASDTPAQVLEVAEELCVEGPCHEAFAAAEPVAYTDISSENSWSRLGSLLAASPVRAVLGVPILHAGRPIGSLDAFCALPRRWTDAEVRHLSEVAEAVAGLIDDAFEDDRRDRDELTQQLFEALEHRHVVQEASEVVAETAGVGLIEASMQLRHMAAAAGVSAVSIAYQVVERGALPGLSELASEAAEVRRIREEHSRLALTDPLTGLTNRVLLLDRLGQALDRRVRSGQSPAVMLIDLDDFKAINDSFGHEAGDEVLRTIAERLRTTIRPQDTASRLGGDEFVVLCDDVADAETALRVARRVCHALTEPICVHSRDAGGVRRDEVTMLASIGVALPTGDGLPRPADLLRDADAAMYAAKRSEQHIALFSEELREASTRRVQLVRRLRDVLERRGRSADGGSEPADELRLVYQPIVDLRTREVHAVEALARWRHPGLGDVPARELVRTAEDSGLVHELGSVLLAQASAAAAGWRRDHSADDVVLAVNVSPAQLLAPGFVDMVAAVLAVNGLPPECLRLELTESGLLEVDGSNADVLYRLAQLGVQLSLDDVGTGYSSLSHLARLPLHQLKIDRGFVAGLDHGRHDTAVAKAVVSLARSLELTTVAEGVETRVQSDRLLALGCELGQGYYYSRPVEPDAVPSLLHAD